MNKPLYIRRGIATLAVGALLATGVSAATATVTAQDGLRLRSASNTSSQVLQLLSKDTQVELLEAVGDSWYRVLAGTKTGYISSQYVTLDAPESEPAKEPESKPENAPVYGFVSASSLNVRSGPDTSYDKVAALSKGTKVELLEELDGWYRIDGGYVSAEYIQQNDSNQTALREQIVAYAKDFLGCGYVLGGTGPKVFDCSGLVQYVYKKFGYSINRTATQQLKNGTTISKADLQPGDLVFFNSAGTGASKATHVGIYIGDGKFLHASSPSVGVVISDLYSAYYKKVYTTARCIL